MHYTFIDFIPPYFIVLINSSASQYCLDEIAFSEKTAHFIAKNFLPY